MILDKVLILKGLAGVTALSGGVGFCIIGHNNNWWRERQLTPEGIKKALGLPASCNLPVSTSESGGSSCGSISAEDLKNINFDGKQQGGATITSGGTATMTITKLSNPDNNYPFGYKFSLQPSQKLTISTDPENSIPANMNIEFKIKKTSGTNQISLEKAWTLQSLAAKVGLENCNDSSKECSIKDGYLNIKQDETKEDSKTKDSSSSSQGKIKVYKDTSNHKEGFKFVIEDGDITLSNGSGTQITKLEQFETYEIEEADGKYYLSRKSKAFSEISKTLGLPSGCDQLTDNATDCSNLNEAKLKTINFEGKSNGVTVDSGATIKLKVTKLTSSDNTFPHGYKFVLESNKEITFTNSTPSLTIKPNTNTEFKIKVKDAENGNGAKTLSLEKAWTAKSLGEKVGLLCEESNNNKECTLPTGKKINVFKETGSYVTDADFGTNDQSKKITFEEGVEGYNQGIKFTATEEITLSNGSTTGSIEKIEKKDSSDSPSYEIKEQTVGDSTNWYLSKHTANSQ